MGRIIDGGRVVEVFSPKKGERASRPSLRGLRACTRLDGKKLDMELYDPKKVRMTGADLALVQERYGTNVSETIQLSIHLVAEAVRAGRLP